MSEKLTAEEKKYLETDPTPWLTKTYSKEEKQEYQRIRSFIYGMNVTEMYKHLSESNIWSRAIREEMDRRSKTPSKKPENPCHEYYEPEACPWCGLAIEKDDDGNYRCYTCGYDHLKERDSYNWDE